MIPIVRPSNSIIGDESRRSIFDNKVDELNFLVFKGNMIADIHDYIIRITSDVNNDHY